MSTACIGACRCALAYRADDRSEGYIGEGDLFVFASVLNEFFALYASINSYHELRVRSTQGDVYQWKPRMGLQPLL